MRFAKHLAVVLHFAASRARISSVVKVRKQGPFWCRAAKGALSGWGRGRCMSERLDQLGAQVAGAPDLEEFVSLLVVYIQEKERVDLVLSRVGVNFECYFVVPTIATLLK